MSKNTICIITVVFTTCLFTSCSKRKSNTFLSSLSIGTVVQNSINDPSATFHETSGGGVDGSTRGERITFYTRVTATDIIDFKVTIKAIHDALTKALFAAGGDINHTWSSCSAQNPLASNRPEFENVGFCYQLNSGGGIVSVWLVSDSDPKNGTHIMIDMYEI